MTPLEALVEILAGAQYIPRSKPEPGPDHAGGFTWILGLLVLVAVVMYVLIELLCNQHDMSH